MVKIPLIHVALSRKHGTKTIFGSRKHNKKLGWERETGEQVIFAGHEETGVPITGKLFLM